MFYTYEIACTYTRKAKVNTLILIIKEEKTKQVVNLC